MTLIKCPECGKEISNRSVSCIYCGFPLTSIATNKLASQQQKTEKETVKTVKQQYITAQKHPGNKKYSYPERWLDKHDRGMINQMGASRRWQLLSMYGGKISDL